jgi:hypothetical protein
MNIYRSLVGPASLLQTGSQLFRFFPSFSMCCSSGNNTFIARQLVRVGFGLALVFAGIAHYREAESFAMSVGNGLGPDWLVGIGNVWGYILPALLILGGLSLTFNVMTRIGVWAAGLGLVSIPAGLMLKSAVTGISLGDTMPPAMNAFVWILIFIVAVKSTECDCLDCMYDSCECGDDCDCGFCDDDGMEEMPAETTKKAVAKPAMKSAMPAAVKSMPNKVAAKKKAPAKKPAAMPKAM